MPEETNAVLSDCIPVDAKQEAHLLQELEEALREADDPATVMVPHEEVMRGLSELRKEWRAQAAKERTAA